MQKTNRGAVFRRCQYAKYGRLPAVPLYGSGFCERVGMEDRGV